MGFHSICSKVDQALVAHIIRNGAANLRTIENEQRYDVFPGKGSTSKALPCTICWTHTARPMPDAPYSGNYLAQAFIEVRTSAVIESDEPNEEQPRLDSDARVSATFDLFQTTDDNSGESLGADITASASGLDITIQNVRVVEVNEGFNPRTAMLQGNQWIDVIHLEILCGPVQGLD